MSDEAPPSRRPSRRWTLAWRVAPGAVVVAALVAVGIKTRSSGAGKAEASTPPTKGAPSGTGDKAKEKTKDPIAVAVAAVEAGAISSYITSTANLVAENEVKVVAEAEGRVEGLLVEEGHAVTRGQTLLRIDPAEAELAVGKADLVLRNARLGLSRAQAMAAEKLISAQDLDKAQYDVDVAAQALAEARHRLSRATVVAPFAGRITLRKVQAGQAVKPGDELLTVTGFEPLVARIFLPERDVLGLALGQEVRLSLRAQEETRFVGRIRQISPVVDTASGTVKVTVEAMKPPSSVRPGAFVTVDVLRETRKEAILVRREAIIRELQEAYVFVADGKVARKRPVTLGLEEGGRVEIRSGLKAGEQVVISGQGGLKEGAPIAIAESADPAKKG